MTLTVRVIAPDKTVWDSTAEEVVLPQAPFTRGAFVRYKTNPRSQGRGFGDSGQLSESHGLEPAMLHSNSGKRRTVDSQERCNSRKQGGRGR
jgi:hypothetical protein